MNQTREMLNAENNKESVVKSCFPQIKRKTGETNKFAAFSHRRNVFCSVFILNKSPQVSLSVTVKLHYKIQFYTAFLIFFYKIRIEREKLNYEVVDGGSEGHRGCDRPKNPLNATKHNQNRLHCSSADTLMISTSAGCPGTQKQNCFCFQ